MSPLAQTSGHDYSHLRFCRSLICAPTNVFDVFGMPLIIHKICVQPNILTKIPCPVPCLSGDCEALSLEWTEVTTSEGTVELCKKEALEKLEDPPNWKAPWQPWRLAFGWFLEALWKMLNPTDKQQLHWNNSRVPYHPLGTATVRGKTKRSQKKSPTLAIPVLIGGDEARHWCKL